MFAEKDKDFDGKLSFEEFSGQETKLEKAFKAMDKDGDGYITKVRRDCAIERRRGIQARSIERVSISSVH